MCGNQFFSNPVTFVDHYFVDYGGTCVLCHLGTTLKCVNYQRVLIFQVSLYDTTLLGKINKCKCLD